MSVSGKKLIKSAKQARAKVKRLTPCRGEYKSAQAYQLIAYLSLVVGGEYTEPSDKQWRKALDYFSRCEEFDEGFLSAWWRLKPLNGPPTKAQGSRRRGRVMFGWFKKADVAEASMSGGDQGKKQFALTSEEITTAFFEYINRERETGFEDNAEIMVSFVVHPHGALVTYRRPDPVKVIIPEAAS